MKREEEEEELAQQVESLLYSHFSKTSDSQILLLSELWRCGLGWQGGNLPPQPARLPHRELGRWNPRTDIEGDFQLKNDKQD